MPKPVLFVCSNQNHVRIFTPVARILERGGANGLAIRWLTLDPYYHHGAEETLRDHGWQERISLPRPPGDTGTPWEGNALTRMRILRHGRTAVLWSLDTARPSVVALGNDLGVLERLFLVEARRRAIPSLLVQDGVIALEPPSGASVADHRRLVRALLTALGLRLPDARPYGLNGADQIAVMGEAFARHLIAYGVPEERIAITGQPRYDDLHALKRGTATPKPLSVPLPAGHKIILFTSQPYVRDQMCSVGEARRIWQTVINGVKELGEGHHLVAKLHPAEDVAWTRRWLADVLAADCTLTRDDDVLSLAFRADALVTVISTTALEALYLEKPVILLDACGVKQPIPYVPSGAALEARTAADLTLRLKEALYDESVRARLAQARRAFVPRHLDIADGRASERVAELVRTLAGA